MHDLTIVWEGESNDVKTQLRLQTISRKRRIISRYEIKEAPAAMRKGIMIIKKIRESWGVWTHGGNYVMWGTSKIL